MATNFHSTTPQTLRGIGRGDESEAAELKEYESRYMRQLELQRDRVKAKLIKQGGGDDLEEQPPTLEQMAQARHQQAFPLANDKRVDTAPISALRPRTGPAAGAPSSQPGRPRPDAAASVRSPMAANLMAEAQQRLNQLESRYKIHDDTTEAVLGEARRGVGADSPALPVGPVTVANGSGKDLMANGTPRSAGGGAGRGLGRPEDVPQASGLGTNDEQRLYQLMAEAERRSRGLSRGSAGAGDANANSVSAQDGLRIARLQAELQRR